MQNDLMCTKQELLSEMEYSVNLEQRVYVYCVPWLLATRGGEGNYNQELCGQETACWRLKVSTKLLGVIQFQHL